MLEGNFTTVLNQEIPDIFRMVEMPFEQIMGLELFYTFLVIGTVMGIYLKTRDATMVFIFALLFGSLWFSAMISEIQMTTVVLISLAVTATIYVIYTKRRD